MFFAVNEVKDDSVFPCPEDQHIDRFWYSSTQEEKSAKVEVELIVWSDSKGCLEGEAREKWWTEMKEILSLTEEEMKEKEKLLGTDSKSN